MPAPTARTTGPHHGTPKRPHHARVSPARQHQILSAIHPEPPQRALTNHAVTVFMSPRHAYLAKHDHQLRGRNRHLFYSGLETGYVLDAT